MTKIDSDIEALLEEVAETPAEESFLRKVLDWEVDRVTLDYRRNKNQKMDEFIEDYIS